MDCFQQEFGKVIFDSARVTELRWKGELEACYGTIYSRLSANRSVLGVW